MTAAATQPDIEARRLKRAALATGVVFALSGTNAGTCLHKILEALDSTHTAVSLVAAASVRRGVLGAPRPAVEQPELDRMLRRAHNALDDSAFDAAWNRGEDLPIQEAVDRAAASLMTLVQTRSR